MQIKEYNNSFVVQAAGEIDHWEAPSLKRNIDKLIDSGEKHVVVDFSKLTYIDSGGISVLFMELKKLKSIGGKITVVTQNENSNEIFNLVNLTEQESFYLTADLADVC